MSITEVVLIVFGAVGFLVIGSFVCVVIDRLPLALDEPNQFGELWDTRPWREVLGGRSRCSSCGTPVRPVDNIPVLSWFTLRGRCHSCGERFPFFHPLVELASLLLFLAAVWALGTNPVLIPALWFIPVALAVTVIDLRTYIVPTRIVWPAFFVSVALAIVISGVEGQWLWLRSAAIGLAVLAGPLFAIWWVTVTRGMGFGDVRLATFIGFNVGFAAGVYNPKSMMAPLMLVVIALALSAVLGLVLGIAALGARDRKASVPFGPSMLVAGFFCMLFAEQILSPFGF